MPRFEPLPVPRRYNTLRLLGHTYSSLDTFYAISLVTDLRRPLFADVKLAKSILVCLLSDQMLNYMRLRAFTLMPNHLHLIAAVRESKKTLSELIGRFKSYTTQIYWKRSQEIMNARKVELPSTNLIRSKANDTSLIAALKTWRACLRPEVVRFANWPEVKPQHFSKKCLWQSRLFDHVIRNGSDLRQNLNYIAMNPVREGYVTRPEFYPYTGFLE